MRSALVASNRSSVGTKYARYDARPLRRDEAGEQRDCAVVTPGNVVATNRLHGEAARKRIGVAALCCGCIDAQLRHNAPATCACSVPSKLADWRTTQRRYKNATKRRRGAYEDQRTREAAVLLRGVAT